MSSANKKHRVLSVHTNFQQKKNTSKRQTSTACQPNTKIAIKKQKKQRTVSLQVTDEKPQLKSKIQQKSQAPISSSIANQFSVQSNDTLNPRLLTVADLQSGRTSNSPRQKLAELSPISQIKIEQKSKTEDAGVQANKTRVTLPRQLQKNLNETIQKLKSKQESIDILNRTIQTRLVSQGQSKEETSKRIDVYEVQINFYVEKISELQKELYEKNKIVSSLTQKNVEFNTVVKNNRKLIGQNHRLKEERQLLERQNAALKKLLIKKSQKSY